MSILTREALLVAIDTGAIVIQPFSKELIGPGSIDLRLGDVFRRFQRQQGSVDVRLDADFTKVTDRIVLKDGETFTLDPGKIALGITMEKVSLADHLCAWLEGRSRFARLGLMIHISSGFLHPGIANHQVLEMANFSPNPLVLHPGTPICQMVVQETKGAGHYSGAFSTQSEF